MTYNNLNNIIKSQSQPEYLSDSTQFQSDNPQIDFTHYNSNNQFIIFSYITDHWPTLINLLQSNNINFHHLHDEFDNPFIII